MKFLSFCLASLFFFTSTIFGVSIDGTSTVKYISDHYVFRNSDYVKGFVYLPQGFTVINGGQFFFNGVESIKGVLDLRETGTLTLGCDVYFEHGVTFSSSGIISSSGSTLHLDSDFAIPASNVMHCRGSMVINGGGNTFEIDRHAQLFLDNEATLTLRNMVIKTQRSFPGKPAIALSTTMCRLAFDNVVLALADDWDVRSGSLFFHNDVVVTGTSALVYRTPAPSYVASGSCLYFDVGTTFSYAPATKRRDLLVLEDATSQVHFNGCSLKTTFTGLTLTKGTVLIENEVSVQTNASFLFDTLQDVTSQPYGTSVLAVAWSPDGKYLAVGGDAPTQFGGVSNNNELQIYAFNNEQLVPVVSYNYSSDKFLHDLAWSGDGRYLFAAGDATSPGSELLAFSFDGTSLTLKAEVEYGVRITSGLDVTFDGQYVMVYSAGGATFKIFNFTGSALHQVVNVTSLGGSDGNGLSLSPDGQYVALGGGGVSGGKNVIVYRVKSASVVEVASLSGIGYVWMVSWSPDGKYLAVGTREPQYLRIYSFNGTNVTLLDELVVPNCETTWGMPTPWSLDGQYLFVGVNGTSGNPDLYVYRFNGQTLTYFLSVDLQNAVNDEFIRTAALSPDGNYIAYGGQSSSSASVVVKKLAYTGSGPAPYNPVANSALRFGNSALGAAGDINVALLGGATLRVKGNILFDPA